MTRTIPYAPVATCEIDIQQGRVIGHAAPAGSPAPCLIALISAETPIAYARATGFSADAAAAGLRMGWCGFDLPGLRQAFALGDLARVICGVSGDLLQEIAADPTAFEFPLPGARTLSAADIVRLAQGGEVCDTIDQLLPFALAHRQRYGDRATIEAAYQTLLRRWPDGGAPQSIDGPDDLDADAHVLHLLTAMIDSEEFRQLWAAAIPGPFHPAFRFDRAVMSA